MRYISAGMEKALKKKVFSKAEGSEVSAEIILSRPVVPLTNDTFLEKQNLGILADSAAIAVDHIAFGETHNNTYIAYVKEGIGRVVSSPYKDSIDEHRWLDSGFLENCTEIDIAFDGTMPIKSNVVSEFITIGNPWVFWIFEGALKCKRLHDSGEIVLADSNCTKVSAVRAAWNAVSQFDFGLIAFYLLNGSLYYRQLSESGWMDAIAVNFGPPNTTWVDLAASRTQDYRVVVQLRSTTGEVYDFFSQYMGIGTRTQEHLSISQVAFSSNIIEITKDNLPMAEHLSIPNIARNTPYSGSYTLGEPSLLGISNVEYNGDWGRAIALVFDKEIDLNSVVSDLHTFDFIDELGISYYPSRVEVDKTGMEVYFIYVDFNNAAGECTFSYSGSSVKTMYGEPVETFKETFTPKNLVPNTNVYPKVSSIVNTNSEGTEVAITFDMPISDWVGDISTAFVVTTKEYDYYPEGPLRDKIKKITKVLRGDDNTILIQFPEGRFDSIRNAAGKVYIRYIGDCLKSGEVPVLGFYEGFIPSGLDFNAYPNDAEHINITDITVMHNIIGVEYVDAGKTSEHISLTDAAFTSKVTHIDDI